MDVGREERSRNSGKRSKNIDVGQEERSRNIREVRGREGASERRSGRRD